MKKPFLFLLLYGFVVQSLSHRNLVASALSQIVRDFYLVQNDRFDLIVKGRGCRELNDIVNEFGKLGQANFPPITIVDLSDNTRVYGMNRSVILLFDNFHSYQDFHRGFSLSNEYPRQFHILVHVLHVSESQASKLILDELDHTADNMFYYESFLVHTESDDLIKLVTFTRFNQPDCRAWNAIEVNRFSMAARKWDQQEFFPEKFSNFHRCELVVYVFYPHSPSIQHTTRGGKELVFGYAVDFFNEAARNLNFRMNSQFISRWTDTNYSLLPPLDFTIATEVMRFLQPVYGDVLHLTEYFATSDEIFLISRFKPYSQMEKLTFAFEKEVWHWLLASLIVALVVIAVIKLTTPTVQRFVFGIRVRSPILNLAVVFFGGGMVVMPGRNFARFLLALYIMFCLIIRTAYQGKQFEFLQKDMRPADVKTIDEMIDRNFTLFLVKDDLEDFADMEFVSRARKQTFTFAPTFLAVSKQITEMLQEGSNRGLLFTDEALQISRQFMPEKLPFSRLQEKVITNYVGFLNPRNNFIFKSLNRKVVQFTESGLAKVIVDRYRITEKPEETSGPKVLTLDHLYAGFYVWLACVAFTIFVFIAEIVVGKLSTMFWETAFRF